ncbi:Phox-like protein [Myriangium duriaei CBS 260.36]|uniref:Phox-like protein n=1 Tax=Myriangium duriaei CBS 260.36 TaxID=1168546 RepID=A0A9P4J224_9PEZI|nr:Phox-like protein [Myriangium duriaei CBS 260.36]
MAPPLQISIPQTSTVGGSKSYTIYHISLTLPLRVHVLQKRYSDFTSLQALLVSQTGLPPPVPLPPKSWLRSTVSSAALTAERRAGLESYLRGIVDSDDPRWRQSSAWREFLSLPAQLTATNETAQADALDPQAWLALHRSVKTHIHTARLALRKRDAAGTAQEQHSASAEAKGEMVKAASGIARCEGALKGYSSADSGGWGSGEAGQLGEGELRRRRDMLFAARKEVEGLETQLRSLSLSERGDGGRGAGAAAVATQADKAALWAGTSTGDAVASGQVRTGRVLGGGAAKETDKTRELDNAGVLMLQKDVMAEQEQDVMELGKAVSRMKEMGILINEELVVQNQMLGMLEQDVDRVQGKLDVGKKRMAKIH